MLISCPLCQEKSELLYTIDRNPGHIFNIYICKTCAFQFRYPLPSEEETKAMYDQGYYEGTNDYTYEDERKASSFYRKVWHSRLRMLQRHLGTHDQKKVFLDIGCSFGGFAQTASEQGFQSFGLEISGYAHEQAQTYSPDVTMCKTLEETGLQTASVDIITMVEVIEHLADPKSLIIDLVDLLKPGGILLIQTANMASKQAQDAGKNYHYYLPGHYSYFSRHHFVDLGKELYLSKVKVFQPVDFTLWAKVAKMRKDYPHMTKEYLERVWNVAKYHWSSYLHWENFAYTASMVVYLIK